MKKYLINQLTQITAWVGLFLIIYYLLPLPSWLLLVGGITLIAVDDDIVKRGMAKVSPSLEKWLNDVLGDDKGGSV